MKQVLNWLLAACNIKCSWFILTVNLASLMQWAELIKIMVAATCSISTVLIMYIINAEKVHDWFRNIYNKLKF